MSWCEGLTMNQALEIAAYESQCLRVFDASEAAIDLVNALLSEFAYQRTEMERRLEIVVELRSTDADPDQLPEGPPFPEMSQCHTRYQRHCGSVAAYAAIVASGIERNVLNLEAIEAALRQTEETRHLIHAAHVELRKSM